MTVKILKYDKRKNNNGTLENILVEELQFTSSDQLLKYYQTEINRLQIEKYNQAELDATNYIKLNLKR